MKPELLTRVITNIRDHEGVVDRMYLDTVKRVTTGVGHMIATTDDACLFDWHRIDRKATRDEIVADYTSVRYGGKRGSLFLPIEEVDRLLAYDLGKFEHILETTFPEFHSFPDGAIVALFDLAFNCGSLRKFPKLTAAVLRGDWATAAGESGRPQVAETRNQNTRDQFLACLFSAAA
jgi:GH24 family phage-related lysozyme (muramidase)